MTRPARALSISARMRAMASAFMLSAVSLTGLGIGPLLIGGLTILMLDLGRPDRLIVAMTYYNFKSIFALNIFLYSGFMGFVIVYLWTMMERGAQRFTPMAGFFAFIWRMALTTGLATSIRILRASGGQVACAEALSYELAPATAGPVSMKD